MQKRREIPLQGQTLQKCHWVSFTSTEDVGVMGIFVGVFFLEISENVV